MERIVTDQKFAPLFCAWVDEKMGDGTRLDPRTTRTIAYVDFADATEGNVKPNILAVKAFHHWSPKAVEVAVATNGEKRQKASHEFIWACYSYIFDVCDKTCEFATISVDNKKCLALAEAMGYSRRGLIPDYFGPNKDAYVCSITKEEWKKGRFAQKEPITINSGKESSR